MRDDEIRTGVRRLFRLRLGSAARIRAEVDEELASLLEARIDDLVARGSAPADARAAALRRLGGDKTLEQVRDRLYHSATHREDRMRFREQFHGLQQDLRLGVRLLVKEPVFTAVAVFTLALGIGANTAIFTVADAVLFRTLPVEHPDALVAIGKPTAIDGHTTGAPRGDLLSLPLYRDLRDHNHQLVSGLAASGTAGRLDVRIGTAGDFEHPVARFVSGNYFDVLGVAAERGRVFGQAEDGPAGASPAVVISDSYWHRRFGGATDVIGRDIDIDGATLIIVGVAHRGFTGDIVERPTDLWLPISMQPVIQPHSASIEQRGTSWLLLLGRLAPGVTLAQAHADFTTLIRTSLMTNASSPGEAARLRHAPISITSGAQGFSAVRRTFRAALVTLQAGVAVLLLIVCMNLANLLLARSVARGMEMSVRLALGGNRSRLARQLMTESALVAVLGATVGLGIAWWGSRALVQAAVTDAPALAWMGIDWVALVFTLVVTVLAVLGFGLAPALRASRADLASPMRASGRAIIASGRGGRIPIGRMLVPLQVALSLVLLTGTALLTRSLRNIEAGDPGLDRDHLLVVDVDVGKRGIAGDRFLALARDISARVANLPGVQAVTYSQNGLFSGSNADALVAVPGFTGRSSADSVLPYDLVGPGYIRAIGGRLLRGRDIDSRDGPRSPSVAVVNEATERFYFGSASAVGKVIYFDAGVPTTIVGVVADVRDHSISGPPERRAYAPYAQSIADADHPTLAFEIRTADNPAALTKAVRAAIAGADPDLPIASSTPLSWRIRDSIREQRLLVTLAIGFGFAALLLAAVGLYGVMSYAVARRTGEIGLRAALGADRGAVLRLVLGDGLRLVMLGVVTGVPLALLVARTLRSQLHDVPATDPFSLAISLVVLLACAAAAVLLPALRASRVPPAVALSQEH